MRILALFATTLLSLSASAAFAQSAAGIPLDEQMRRLQNKPAATNAAVEITKPESAAVAPAETPATDGLPRARNGEAIDSVGSGAIPALPIELVNTNGVSYLSGGIGDEEIEQLKAQAANFNLHILITAADGEFVSGVALRILGAGGKEVVAIEDAGPQIYINLPTGAYKLEVKTTSGAVKTSNVKLTGKTSVKTQIRI